ncbi:M15 family metallopeptidase [Ramlibacter sp. 2FC]|uniref:M15 family metallopeptidase n=1 Tax=Ramlibacter sp. 2FC TaxID=2502188 RepID=UPI0010F98344|nr:M15 family metallopeptidase [Ramlibacter sp. 2FC]
MRLHNPNLVPATPASALVFGDSPPGISAFQVAESGERTVHLPSLRAHRAAGFAYDLSGPNCVLRWARIAAGYSGPVDMVLHFHGYQGHNQMRLAAKAAASGLDLDRPGVGRPTLGLVPHGHAFRSRMAGVDGFDFPAISTAAELDAFVDEALAAWARETGGGRLTRGRLILSGHSGGGAALTKLMRAIGDQARVHGFQYFDATYGGQPTLTQRQGWIEAAIARDAAALANLADEAARRRYLQSQGSHLRICFIDGSGTAAAARAADAFVRERLQALVPDAGLRELLRKHYRAQKVARPAQVGHNLVPRSFGGRLLADPGNDLAPEAQDLAAPGARAHGFAEAWDDMAEEAVDEQAQQSAWEAEAQDVTVPVLVTRERAADAPGGAAFIASLGERKGVERENRIFEQLRAGNIPASLLTFHTVRTSGTDRAGQRHEFEFYVTPDLLAIGSESDAVRIPMDPVTAQRIADSFDCLLPTARMVEQIYQAAPTKLAFIPGNYAGTPRAHLQDASSSYLWHSQQIDGQLRRPPTILTAGHKKEIVISNNYMHRARNKQTGELGPPRAKLAFYGAYTAAGVPIQAPRSGGQVLRGHPSFAHEPSFVDYSHGVRLVWPTMKLDGAERRVAEVLRDPNLSLLIAAEGAIAEPRYTLDRSGRAVSARAQAWSSEDPLGLAWGDQAGWASGALGYGSSWDERLRTTVEGFLAQFMGIPVRIGSQTVRVHPPYFMNAHASSAAATRERHRIAGEHRAAAPTALRALIAESRFAHARIGKSTPEMLRELLQAADAAGLLQADATVNRQPTAQNLRRFLQHYGLGVDCSGFVSQAINKLIGLFPNAAAADRIAAPHSTSSAALKGGQGSFERVTDPAQLCGGDTMWLQGHIRILAWAERRGDRIWFCTAESRSSNPSDIGPAVYYWRLVPDAQAGAQNFRGWRLERSGDLNAPDSGWQRVNTTHVYGHYRPLRRLLQAAGATSAALASDEAWALQAVPRAYGRAFVPRQATFNRAPAGGFTVVPASFLPASTTNAAAAIDTALTAAGLDAAQRGQISRGGLTPIAAAFGASALTELFARLRWSPAFIVQHGARANAMLVPRLLIHVVGHFRELARRAPSAAEAFVLECLGWAMTSNLRQSVENATGQRWWIPPAPDFVTAVPNPIPAVGAEVRQLIMRLGFIDTVMPAGNWNARYQSWRTGLAGRQWDAEVNAAQPGLPLYASLLTVPAHVNTAATRTAFNAAWRQRLADTDAAHAPIPAGAAQVTLSGLQNAASLRRCDNGNPHIPAGTFGALNLQGLELVEGFPALAGSANIVRRLTLLNQIHPVCTALFRAIRELGWNDLIYETEGSTCFRGVKHNPRVVVNVGGSQIAVAPFSAPNADTVNRINNLATATARTAVIAAARSARTLSDHGMGMAIDINYPENVDNVAARAFGSMDPRVVAIFEAFNFRWGASFNPTDPHHFDYCQTACAPAPVAATPAPPPGPLPGMIPSGSGGPVVA